MAKELKIYTATYCPHCARAKQLLKDSGIAFREIDVTEDEKARQALQDRTGWSTVPMIFIGDEFIGGADKLFELEASGELAKKVSE